ncbi:MULTISPECIES: hypothetical protein [Priestia]|uniref:hypothetical protein n=1 Tax=Priestia TaxID=2800373 RepID=UPI000E710D92|nr:MULTISPECIES: hypothetical protein [Priestia]MDT3766151.1 hypothetical protein [Priestia filamentosa]RJS63002.1 hypothetical protein CJ485_23975 [Priestia filamentosa]RPK03128.1 hypothetical protein FH5_02204 [Priestia endophytica]WRU97837.1 hypothetical protein RYX51_22825 [Priestia filamentosa]
MDIIVRNIDPTAVKKFDELAKEKGISRQEFLKGQLETLAFFREQTNRELQLENMLEKVLQMMGQCSNTMENMNDIMHELMGGDESL